MTAFRHRQRLPSQKHVKLVSFLRRCKRRQYSNRWRTMCCLRYQIISTGCCRSSPAHTSLTPTSGIYHHLQPETSCSQSDITRQTPCSWQL